MGSMQMRNRDFVISLLYERDVVISLIRKEKRFFIYEKDEETNELRIVYKRDNWILETKHGLVGNEYTIKYEVCFFFC